MQVSLYRYNPDVDEAPKMREMTVDLPDRQRPDGAGCAGAAENPGRKSDVSPFLS